MKIDILSMIQKSAPDSVIRLARKGSALWSVHGADICAGMGIGLSLLSTIEGINATMKVQPILDEAKANIDGVKAQYGNNTDCKEYKRDLAKAYFAGGRKIAKNYALTAALEAGSALSTWHGRSMYNSKVNDLEARAAELAMIFKEYRNRVVNDQGELADKKYYTGISQVEVTETKEDGESETKTVNVASNKPLYTWARVFDKQNPNYTGILDKDLFWIQSKEDEWNWKGAGWGMIFMNDVLRDMNFKIVDRGQDDGWIWDPDGGKSQICFDATDYINSEGETVFLIEFNCRPNVRDAIKTIYGAKKAHALLPGV